MAPPPTVLALGELCAQSRLITLLSHRVTTHCEKHYTLVQVIVLYVVGKGTALQYRCELCWPIVKHIASLLSGCSKWNIGALCDCAFELAANFHKKSTYIQIFLIPKGLKFKLVFISHVTQFMMCILLCLLEYISNFVCYLRWQVTLPPKMLLCLTSLLICSTKPVIKTNMRKLKIYSSYIQGRTS